MAGKVQHMRARTSLRHIRTLACAAYKLSYFLSLNWKIKEPKYNKAVVV